MSAILHVVFLSFAMGLYLFVFSIILLCRASYYRALIASMKSGGTVLVAASVGLMVGLTLVVMHTTWVWNVQGVITLIGWLILIKSILWLSFPECMVSCTKKVFLSWFYYVAILITALVGIFLISHGFYVTELVSECLKPGVTCPAF